MSKYLLIACLLVSCSPYLLTHDEEIALWIEVSSQYDDCHVEMPPIAYTEELIGGRYFGVYFPNTKQIIVNSYFSKDVLEHEFKHACGDMQGESAHNVRVVGLSH